MPLADVFSDADLDALLDRPQASSVQGPSDEELDKLLDSVPRPSDKRIALLKEREQFEPETTSLLTRALLGVSEGAGSVKRQAGGALSSPLATILAAPVDPEGAIPPEQIEAGARGLREVGRTLKKSGQEQIERYAGLGKDTSSGIAGDIAQALTATIAGSSPTIPAALLGGFPLAIGAAGMQTLGAVQADAADAYKRANPNLTDEEAENKAFPVALSTGAITAALTAAFGGTERFLSELGKGTIQRQGAKPIIKEVLRSSGLEVPEEALDQTSQDIISNLTYEPGKTPTEIVSSAVKAGLLGGASGLVTGGAVAGIAGTAAAIGDQVQESVQRRFDQRRATDLAAINRLDPRNAQLFADTTLLNPPIPLGPPIESEEDDAIRKPGATPIPVGKAPEDSKTLEEEIRPAAPPPGEISPKAQTQEEVTPSESKEKDQKEILAPPAEPPSKPSTSEVPLTPPTIAPKVVESTPLPLAQTQTVADFVKSKLSQGTGFSWQELFNAADQAYGGTQAQGRYTVKDAYDAMELGINQFIRDAKAGQAPFWNIADDAGNAIQTVKSLKQLITQVPTQTKRTTEQDEFQQFSTPPPLAFVVSWVANIKPADVVLEPSAGIGGLAVFPKTIGATVIANELSPRRREVLGGLGLNQIFGENAEQLHNILPPSIQPTVVVMNPPFSATAGRITGRRDTKFAEAHIEQALTRLAPGGRLVAIVGEGMAYDRPAFKSWWRKIKSRYNVRANIGIDGGEYTKYGTSFGNQILVIDKPLPNQPVGVLPTLKESVQKTEDLIPLLEGIRNERTASTAQRPTEAPAPATIQVPPAAPPTPEPAPEAATPGSVEPGPDQPASQTTPAQREGAAADDIPARPPASTVGTGTETSTGDERGGGIGQTGRTDKPDVPLAPGPSDEFPASRGPVGQQPGGTGIAGPAGGPSGSGGLPPDGTGQQRPPDVPGLAVAAEAEIPPEEQAPQEEVFEDYKPQMSVPGAQKHPTALSESAAMRSVRYPTVSYRPKLPQSAITEGKISDAQLENVMLAGAAHAVTLPDGSRRGFFIGDGCVSPATRILNPITGEESTIKELCDKGEPHTVLSLTPNGFVPAFAHCPFLKGIAQLFTVTMESGKSVLVTGQHRFLTPSGWTKIDDGLSEGHFLASFVSRPQNNSASCQSAQVSNDPHLTGTPEDYLTHCSAYYRQYGEPPPTYLNTALNAAPLLSGVLGHTQLSSHLDDRNVSAKHNRRRQLPCRRSRNSSSQAEIPSLALTSSQFDASPAQLLRPKRRAPRPFHVGRASQPTQTPSKASRPEGLAYDLSPCENAVESQPCPVTSKRLELKHYTSTPAQLLSRHECIHAPDPLSSHQELHSASYASQLCSRWDRIVSIRLADIGEFYDMYVPGHENYVAHGIVHHNTGVGKGRSITGIMFDNWNNGRKKHVWISKNKKLIDDARRDIQDMGFPGSILKLPKASENIKEKEGVLFTTYNTLKQGPSKKDKSGKARSRIAQIAEWLGKDFDGVIAFDEAHAMANALESRGTRGTKKASANALAGMELQRLMPNARIVYVSATGATEVSNLAYAPRLGLWGEDTPFANVQDFVNSIAAGGVSAGEVVAKDLKSLGLYMARSLNFKGVEYQKLEHKLTEKQTALYDQLASAWQIVLRNVNAALELTGGVEDRDAKKNARGAFWGAHQRFFNGLLTTLQLPSLIAAIKKDISNGHAVVIQLVTTNEASQERAAADAIEDETDLEDLEISGKDVLIQYVDKSFPTQQFQEEEDENGNVRMRPVVDSSGNPVQNAEAVALKNDLLNQLASLNVPQGMLDSIIEEFGADKVAEITGRQRRLVRNKEGKKEWENRGETAAKADALNFNEDRKHILIFSDAGGTGASYHADKRFKNRRLRRHYIAQPGWRADNAIQGLGRSHRSNQQQPPEFITASTDLPGHKRFVSTIARRLEQLGALTKGQRQTASQGVFSARDNLESPYAKEALRVFLRDLASGRVEGLSAMQIQNETGLRILDENGEYAGDSIEIRQFLNRLLSLTVGTQHMVFNAFSSALDRVIEYHISNGTMDVGLETLTALKTTKISEEVLFTEPNSGAQTKLVELDLEQKTRLQQWTDKLASSGTGFVANNQSGNIWHVSDRKQRMDADGNLNSYYILGSPRSTVQVVKADEMTRERFTILEPTQARTAWEEEIKSIPPTYTEKAHVITGTILPVWDRLGRFSKIVRATTNQGERLLGVLIPRSELSEIRKKFGLHLQETITANDAVGAVINSGATAVLSNGWKIMRRRVSGEERIELMGPEYSDQRELEGKGVILERIEYKMRYFIPTGPRAVSVLESIIKSKPVIELQGGQGQGDIVSRLESKKILGGGEVMLPILPGLDPASLRAIWNTAIDIAIAAIKAGRAISAAVQSGWEHIKAQLDSRGISYDETELASEFFDAVSTAQSPSPTQTPALERTTTQILGLDEPSLRRVLKPEDLEAGQRDAERLFTEAGIPWVRGPDNLLKPSDPSAITDENLNRLITIAQREFDPVNQAKLARNDAPFNDRRANFNNSIREWARQTRSAMMSGQQSHLSRALFDQLEGIAQGQASEAGKRLYLFKEPQIDDLTRIANGPEIELLDAWSESYGVNGGVRKTLQTIRLYFQRFFTADQIDNTLAANPQARDFLEDLLGESSVSPKPTVSEMIQTIFNTPIYRQGDLGDRLVAILTRQLNIDPTKAQEARVIFEEAFKDAIATAKKRALAQAQQALTPQERRQLKPRTKLWRRLEQFVNAGGLEDYEFFKAWIESKSGRSPTDAEIMQFKALAIRSQKLLELSPRQLAQAGSDPAKLAEALRARKDATQDERQVIQRKMVAMWKRWSRPVSWRHWRAGLDIAYNNAQALNEWAAGNILTRLTFATKQAIDIGTASAFYTPQRALAHAFARYANSDRSQGAINALWQDVTDALGEAYSVRGKTYTARWRSFGQAFKGRGLPSNVEGIKGGIHAFDRIQLKIDDLLKQGTPKARAEAFLWMIGGLGNLGFRVSGALDTVQGLPAEFQELRQIVVTELRGLGKTRAEANLAADTVIGDIQAERTLALAEARAILEESLAPNRSPSDGEVSKAAWEIVKGRMYARIKALGLPADAFEARAQELRQIIGWNLPETGGIGGVAAISAKGLQEFFAKLGVPTLGVAAFGNAIGTLINRKLTWAGLGFFPKAFGDSPWYRSEIDQMQRQVEAGTGLAIGTIVFLLASSGALLVRLAWPDDPKERERWEKEGIRPGMVEIPLGDGQKMQVSMTTGPLSFVSPYLAAGGAYYDLATKRAEQQAKLDADAAAKGLPAGKVDPVTTSEALGVIAAAAKSTILGGRTTTGLMGTFSDYGKFDLKRSGAAFLGSATPFQPAYAEFTRLAGVSLDPKRASFWDLLVPMPTSEGRRVNMLGDEVGNQDSLQRVLGMMSGGTSIRTRGRAQDDGLPYANLFASAYRPPVLSPGKGYDFGTEFRPMRRKEFDKYVAARGRRFKEQLSSLGPLDNLDSDQAYSAVQAAFQRANDDALRSVGVYVPKRAQTASRPRTRTARATKRTTGTRRLSLRMPKPRLPGTRRQSLRSGLRRQLRLRSARRPRLPRLAIAA